MRLGRMDILGGGWREELTNSSCFVGLRLKEVGVDVLSLSNCGWYWLLLTLNLDSTPHKHQTGS